MISRCPDDLDPRGRFYPDNPPDRIAPRFRKRVDERHITDAGLVYDENILTLRIVVRM
jgi:hypothetical protein